MGAGKKKKATKVSADQNNKKKKKNTPNNVAKVGLSIFVGLVAISVALAIHQHQNPRPKKLPLDESSARSRSGSFEMTNTTSRDFYKLAKTKAYAAQDDPYSVEQSHAVSEAYFLAGYYTDSSQWTSFTLRRQALNSGATPDQAMAAQNHFAQQHFLQHLEANLVLLSRVILQGGPRYVESLEEHCSGSAGKNNNNTQNTQTENTETVSSRLEKNPNVITRSDVMSLVVQCMLKVNKKGNILKYLQDKQNYMKDRHNLYTPYNDKDKAWTIWHFLAHFGSPEIVQQAMEITPLPKGSTKDIWGRTPADIAALKGFDQVKQMLGKINKHEKQPKLEPKHPSTIIPIDTSIQALFSNGNGGWGTTKTKYNKPSAPEYQCDIPIVQDGLQLTKEEFVQKYMAKEQPVLIRNGASSSFSYLQQDILAKAKFYELFGRMPIETGPVPYQITEQMTVQHFVEQFDNQNNKRAKSSGAPNYLFESLPFGHPLRQQVESHFPGYAITEVSASRPEERQVQIAIGPAGSGAPPHYHKAAVNTLFYGLKQWFLFPPKDAIYTSNLSAQEWVQQYQKDKQKQQQQQQNNQETTTAAATATTPTIVECIQQPGDVLFIPDFWGHATLNVEPSVAVASEFITPRMDFEMVLPQVTHQTAGLGL